MRSSLIFGSAVIAAVLFGCTPAVQSQDTEANPQSDTSSQSDNCAALQAVQTDRDRYGIPTPSEDRAELSQCGRYGGHSEPPVALSSSSAAQAEEIPIERRGGEYVVPVRVNQTITLPFILDTGATELVIPVDVALTLMRAGALTRSDLISPGRYTMANGSEEIQDRVIIREVQVGDHTATDVPASVSSVASSPLLGESFLSKFGTVTIDYNRLVLILSR
jgi:clan AA aspartic protease (TIGR02281 family)